MMLYRHIALVGNPNSGKSTLFNLLTGLHQKVGNFPGVTVESLEGKFKTFGGDEVRITDLPGSYSLHTNSKDEQVLGHALTGIGRVEAPEALIYVADLRYLHQQLLLLTQVLDLNFPTMIVLTNRDQVNDELAMRWEEFLSQKTGCIVTAFSARLGYTAITLKDKLQHFLYHDNGPQGRRPFFNLPGALIIEGESDAIKVRSPYHQFLLNLDETYCRLKERPTMEKAAMIRCQIDDTMSRYSLIENWESQIRLPESKSAIHRTRRLDRVLTNPFWGIVIFFIIMCAVFQIMYTWAEFPMNAIEDAFAYTSGTIRGWLPDVWWSHLITEGIIPGLAGVLVFIPQILLLFLMLGILEEAGYMTRVVYLLDHMLARFGLNGRSIIGLISGGACAIPAIMSTRSIYNAKERLISMFVIPLIPCSARIPVYTALIGFVVSKEKIFGIFQLQGLVFMGLYFIGILAALLVALVLHHTIPSEGRSFLIMQLPNYQLPPWRQVFNQALLKVKSFVLQAGKIIMMISVILWFLASFGWPGKIKSAEEQLKQSDAFTQANTEKQALMMEATLLENSFAGTIGKTIEPLIAPLGFDWKIGISLITSFAAREVFVGTMSTIYSIGSTSDEFKLREVLSAETRRDGSRFFDRRTALSLIIFYAFSLQCMSTLAIMRKETGSWKTPVLQFIFFGILAYLSSFAVFHFF